MFHPTTGRVRVGSAWQFRFTRGCLSRTPLLEEGSASHLFLQTSVTTKSDLLWAFRVYAKETRRFP